MATGRWWSRCSERSTARGPVSGLYLRGKAGGKKLAFFPIVPRAGTSCAGERVGKAEDRDTHLVSSLAERSLAMKDGNGTVVK